MTEPHDDRPALRDRAEAAEPQEVKEAELLSIADCHGCSQLRAELDTLRGMREAWREKIQALEADRDHAREEREKLQIEVDGQRRMFADYADRIQELQIKAENAEWGHFKHNIMALLNIVHESAKRCAKGELGYIAVYNKLIKERDAAHQQLERAGYRRCDSAACNCNGWHGGHSTQRLLEIGDALGIELTNGRTILEAVVALKAHVQLVLCHVAQIFDGWHQDGTAWSLWDESVREMVGAVLREVGGETESGPR